MRRRGISILLLARTGLAWVGLAWVGLVWVGLVRADHGPRPSQLEHSVLCFDGSSVRAAIEREGERRDPALEASLAARLRQELQEVMGRLEVAHETRADCRGAGAYTQLQAIARFLDPETYLNFPAASYSFSLILQVGDHGEIAALELEETYPGALHVLFSSALHAESEDGGIGERLAEVGAEQIRALARAWWDDNAEAYARGRERRLTPAVGAGLAAALALALALGLSRRRRR